MSSRVSVIIPVYNAQSYIEDCIKSIISQTYSNLEIFVIDDASTDNSIKVIESFNDDRISIIRNPCNLGLAASVNKAISQSVGTFIARMDADDIALPSRIQKQVEFLEDNPTISIVGSAMKSFGYEKFTHHFPLMHDDCKAQLLFNVCFGHPTVVFRREVFNGGNAWYDETLQQYSEEYELWCRLVDQCRFANLPDILLYYRTYPTNQKAEGNIKRRQNSYLIRSRFLTSQWKKEIPKSKYKIHDHISNLDRALNPAEFTTWVAWLKELKEMNSSDGKSPFSTDSLKRQFEERCFELYYWNTQLGLAHWNQWRMREERFNPGIMKKLKFLFKSIIRK